MICTAATRPNPAPSSRVDGRRPRPAAAATVGHGLGRLFLFLTTVAATTAATNTAQLRLYCQSVRIE
jgi:hypothetical protein